MTPLPELCPSGVSRLDFVLPAFVRVAWVDDRAREIWDPRLARIAGRWRDIEWRTIVEGVRPCALCYLSHEEFVELVPRLAPHGLDAVAVTSGLRPLAGTREEALVHRVAVGKRRELAGFRRAWVRGDDDAIGQCLGYPTCCRSFFRRVVVNGGWVDATWPRALGSIQSGELERGRDVDVTPELNLFWEALGVRLVPHVPCSYDCDAARTLAEAFIATGGRAGYKSDLDHAVEALRWPVEWSALHGIAEIKTPIVKLATRTDATSAKLVVRYRGEQYPREGARGMRFPYAVPAGAAAHRLKVVR